MPRQTRSAKNSQDTDSEEVAWQTLAQSLPRALTPQTPHTGLVASGTEREYSSVVSSHPVCGD